MRGNKTTNPNKNEPLALEAYKNNLSSLYSHSKANIEHKADRPHDNISKEKKKLSPSSPPFKTTNISKEKSLKLKILQWNVRSLNSESKINYIKSLECDLYCLQEIWKQEENLHLIGRVLISKIRKNQRGGGTGIIVNDLLTIKKSVESSLSKDSSLIKLAINGVYIWVGNIYFPIWTHETATRLFGKLRSTIPPNEWANVIITGDFNLNVLNNEDPNVKNLRSLCKQMGLNITPPIENTRGNSCLDFAVFGHNISLMKCSNLSSPSDHNALIWEIEIKNAESKSKVKIPNMKLAKEVTNSLISNCKSLKEFYEKLSVLRHVNKKKLKILVKPPRKDTSLLEKLIETDETIQMQEMIKNHWGKIWRDIEGNRFSKESSVAYKDLKRITRYHLYEKRDGAIIQQLISEDNEIVTNRAQVDELLAQTITEIQVDPQAEHLEKKKFPILPELSAKEFSLLISNQLSYGKAIAHDNLCDLMFKHHIDEDKIKTLSEEDIIKLNPYSEILNKLWSVDLDELKGFEKTWEYRLCALNKVFPRIPNRRQMRPINIGSPILKALEARFLPPLKKYLRERLDRAQTGFVDGMGIFVNLRRAVNRIQLRTGRKGNQVCYGLFVDFSNAYNMVPHKLLFEKLRSKKVLHDIEIDYLEQIYSRLRIRVGKHIICPNRGVAQGSILSPALFNIFIEDLSQELQMKAGINIEDLLFYADDLLTICTSPEQLRTAIQVIKEWSKNNGMLLNESKSGIVVFANRNSKTIPWMRNSKLNNGKQNEQAIWMPTKTEFEGIPICNKYKYLGTWLDNKLTVQNQISHIKKKAGHVISRLYPYLKQASAEGRRDMWTTMIQPLFGALFPIVDGDKTKKAQSQALVLWRSTFKSMMLIPKRTNSQIISWMIGKEFEDLCIGFAEISTLKWKTRKTLQPIYYPPSKLIPNPLQGVPHQWCSILSRQASLCKLCLEKGIKNKVLSSAHLLAAHNIRIMSAKKIWRGIIQPILNGERSFGGKHIRKRITRRLVPILDNILNAYTYCNV